MDPETYPRGVDVSHWHPVVNWSELVADGISFVGIKTTQGASYRDPTLIAHRDGRRANAGQLIGSIFFHYPNGGRPEIEAANFLSAIGELQDDEYLALDVEQGPTGIGAPMLPWIQAWNAAIPKRYRKTDGRLIPNGVYTATHVWNELGNPPWPDATAGNVFLWLKRYASDYGECPPPWSYPTIWQNSATGVVPGVTGPQVDLDFFVGDSAACRAFFKGA